MVGQLAGQVWVAQVSKDDDLLDFNHFASSLTAAASRSLVAVMNGQTPAMGKVVLFAGLVTLAVTGLRLYGELHDWDPRFFSKEPGGQLAVVGISWLIFVFGFWFGARLARAGQGPRSAGKAIVLHLVATAVLVGTVVLNFKVLQSDTKSLDGLRSAMFVNLAGEVVAALIALAAWPRLWVANLSYGLLARIPVVVVTYLACARQWGTHYEQLGPDNLTADPMVKAFWLSVTQLTLWPVLTVLLGGLCGSLAALVFRGRRGG